MVISEPDFLKKVDILSDLASNILPEGLLFKPEGLLSNSEYYFPLKGCPVSLNPEQHPNLKPDLATIFHKGGAGKVPHAWLQGGQVQDLGGPRCGEH